MGSQVYRGTRGPGGVLSVTCDGRPIPLERPHFFYARNIGWGRQTRCETQLAAVLLVHLFNVDNIGWRQALRFARRVTQRLPFDGWTLAGDDLREMAKDRWSITGRELWPSSLH